jgi:hypothetical protein
MSFDTYGGLESLSADMLRNAVSDGHNKKPKAMSDKTTRRDFQTFTCQFWQLPALRRFATEVDNCRLIVGPGWFNIRVALVLSGSEDEIRLTKSLFEAWIKK